MRLTRPWQCRPCDPVKSESLAARLNLHPITAQCLLHRGLGEAERARAFLDPKLTHLTDPHAFSDMERAATRLMEAVKRREPVAVVGDYDVDGLSATALLARFLKALETPVQCVVPDRLRDGYGMRPQHVEQALASGARLLITVDNGTSAHAATKLAAERGLDVIITDHHEPSLDQRGNPVRPPCLALLNPKWPGNGYPFAGLAGCGVAFKLAWACATALSPGKRAEPALRRFLLDALALVAVGTIADAVPLCDENRTLVRFGLRALANTPHAGLRALVRTARLRSAPEAGDVAFQLGPRLNAAGRLGHAGLALDLLLCEDRATANELAQRLDALNMKRRELERQLLEEALQQAERSLEETNGAAVVLAGRRWHHGVIGIVASRLVERFERPVVLIGLEGERGRGSARSVTGVALHEGLSACAHTLERHGGHAMAAGLEIRSECVPAFRHAFGAWAQQQFERLGERSTTSPLWIDLDVQLAEISHGLVRELALLGPHGRGNEAPIFRARGLRLAAAPRVVGADRRHLQLHLGQGPCVRKAIGFRLAERLPTLTDTSGHLEAAFRPICSRFGGTERVELELVDLREQPDHVDSGTPARSTTQATPRPKPLISTR